MKSNNVFASVSATALMLAVILATAIAFSTVKVAHADDYGDVGDLGGDYSDVGDLGGGYNDVGDLGGGYENVGDLGGDYGNVGDLGGEYSNVGDLGNDYCGCDTQDFQTGYTSMTPSYGGTSFGGSSYRPISFSYPSTPTTFYAPSYRAPAPVVSTPSVTNFNNNTNTNVNNNNININNNSSAVAIATVSAAPVQYQAAYVQPVYQQPYCTISLSNYNGNSYGPNSYNQLATLSWSSSNATSGYISPNVGTVSGYGSMQVYPTNGQTYTMTVYGQGGGTANCSTQPYYMQNYIAPQPVVYNNPTPYVSLSQIPYTGFDFGTLGNSIYWLALMVFAGAAAYLVLYFNGGALAILNVKRSGRRSQVEMPKITFTRAPAQVAVVQKEAMVVSPIQLATNRTNTSDTMHITHSKAGIAPRIHISRE